METFRPSNLDHSFHHDTEAARKIQENCNLKLFDTFGFCNICRVAGQRSQKQELDENIHELYAYMRIEKASWPKNWVFSSKL